MNIAQETQTWAMLLHFSILASWVVPLAGLILPILIWQVKKKELPKIDIHGRIVMNWIISQLIYIMIFSVLAIFLIRFPLSVIGIYLFLFIQFILNIFFAVVGGIKANNGKVWRYPFSIRFLK